jgi:hypothetical protein
MSLYTLHDGLYVHGYHQPVSKHIRLTDAMSEMRSRSRMADGSARPHRLPELEVGGARWSKLRLCLERTC